jgi:hypothetical protein
MDSNPTLRLSKEVLDTLEISIIQVSTKLLLFLSFII